MFHYCTSGFLLTIADQLNLNNRPTTIDRLCLQKLCEKKHLKNYNFFCNFHRQHKKTVNEEIIKKIGKKINKIEKIEKTRWKNSFSDAID